MRLDPDLLQAVAATLDQDLAEVPLGSPPHHVIAAALDRYERPDQALKGLVVPRVTLAMQVVSSEDLEARRGEFERAVQVWLDGFAIALRYAHQANLPKPKREML